METVTEMVKEQPYQEAAGAVREAQPVHKPSWFYLLVKRVFDIAASGLGLVLVSPVLLVLIYLIRREDGGSATYICTRVGKNGKPLRFRKFRSMVLDADDLEKYLTPEQLEQYQREFKLDNDPRITKIGRFLRRSSLDELLQLTSVLKGDMSLVGPRPIVEEELHFYSEPELAEFLSATPGLTGYWQAHGRSNATYQSGLRQELELYYVRNQSLWLDIKILFKTVGVVLRGVGAK